MCLAIFDAQLFRRRLSNFTLSTNVDRANQLNETHLLIPCYMAPDVQESTGTQPANDLDADQIHNLINMAMANAYDTVSSWLQPPSAAVLEADEKLRISNHDFEKMAFRPAR